MKITLRQLKRLISEGLDFHEKEVEKYDKGHQNIKNKMIEDAESEGRRDSMSGFDDATNPYPEGHALAKAWDKGAKDIKEYGSIEEGNQMKISKNQLKTIIKEEKAKLVKEQAGGLPGEIYDLERDINDFIILVDRFFASGKVMRYLEPTGALDDPNSWAVKLEELRYDLGEIRNQMMGGKRRIR